jgi:hypothetical protein
MTTATGRPPNVEAYMEALRAELGDLAAEEREDLLSEVAPSLLEAAGAGDDTIAARLGPPADFAADLRASAGLPPAPRAAAPRPGMRAALAELAGTPAVRRARAVAGELAPAWWAIRAAIAVGVLGLVIDAVLSDPWPYLPRHWSAGGTVVVGLAALLALAGSCGLGLTTRRGLLHRTSVAVSAAALLAAPFVFAAARSAARDALPADGFAYAEPLPAAGLAYDGRDVQNVYAYDRSGRLLQDVRLYDDAGQPIEWGRDLDDRGRRLVTDARGATAFNAFPVRYFEPGTNRVADPSAGAPAPPPPLVTPALTRPRATDAAPRTTRRDRTRAAGPRP